MPIITETVESSSTTISEESVVKNYADAVAKAIGGETKTTTDGITYICMDQIGYPGWCFIFRTHLTGGVKYMRFDIGATMADGTLDRNDERYWVGYSKHTTLVSNNQEYKLATCVMLCDDSKDTVLFNIHRGNTTHGTDITVDEHSAEFVGFLAKDSIGNVLAGAGRLFPVDIRTLNKRGASTRREVTNAPENATVLHLTKMVNYLSPGCPEMKSAYVSVVRPGSDYKVSDKKYVGLYNLNGVQYGRASYINSLDPDDIVDGKCYYPFDPFVKY